MTHDNSNDQDINESEGSSDFTNDIALQPDSNADSKEEIEKYILEDVRKLYEVYSYRHAAAILSSSFPNELQQIQNALLSFSMTMRDIGMPGGNESVIPKKFSKLLRPTGWLETRVQGDLLVRLQEYEELEDTNGVLRKSKKIESTPRIIKNFIDGHKIDYVKNGVAFDMEWNSKDQTFDRDLYALRAFHECGLISAGVMVTRSVSLNEVFNFAPQLNKEGQPEIITKGNNKGQNKTVRAKYGASTTWMGKLLYRLNAGRHGGCPILVFGITPNLIKDWNKMS